MHKHKDKPSGLYRSQSWEGSCDFCAYQGMGNFCAIRKEVINGAERMKCADWLHKHRGISKDEQP